MSQPCENYQRIFLRNWPGNIFERCIEIMLVAVIELTRNVEDVFEMRIGRVRRTFVPVKRKHGALWLGGVDPGGLATG